MTGENKGSVPASDQDEDLNKKRTLDSQVEQLNAMFQEYPDGASFSRWHQEFKLRFVANLYPKQPSVPEFTLGIGPIIFWVRNNTTHRQAARLLWSYRPQEYQNKVRHQLQFELLNPQCHAVSHVQREIVRLVKETQGHAQWLKDLQDGPLTQQQVEESFLPCVKYNGFQSATGRCTVIPEQIQVWDCTDEKNVTIGTTDLLAKGAEISMLLQVGKAWHMQYARNPNAPDEQTMDAAFFNQWGIQMVVGSVFVWKHGTSQAEHRYIDRAKLGLNTLPIPSASTSSS
jgi:hypothetical protein